MILFGLPPLTALGAAVATLADVRQGRATVGRFGNGELYATVETPVAGQACAVIGSVAPPDANLLSTLLLAHTLAKDGAASVTAVLPYLGYARHDRYERGKSLGTAWMGRLLQAADVRDVVAVDVHSPRAHELVPVPVRSLSPAGVFADELVREGLDGVGIVAPDEGAIERCEAVRRAAGITRPLAHFTKRRTEQGIVHLTLSGAVPPRAVVVDDILDTGATLLSACEHLMRTGAREIRIMVTHALFTGTAWERLPSIGVTHTYCTDTTPRPGVALPLTVLSVAPLLAAHLGSAAVRAAA